jgi:hypothetical protein
MQLVTIPIAAGNCNHLNVLNLPSIDLPSTLSTIINSFKVKGLLVIVCHPMIGHPQLPLPIGWDAIPGAKGRNPQFCSFRDLNAEFAKIKHLVAEVEADSKEEISIKELATNNDLELAIEKLRYSTLKFVVCTGVGVVVPISTLLTKSFHWF